MSLEEDVLMFMGSVRIFARAIRAVRLLKWELVLFSGIARRLVCVLQRLIH